MFLCATFAYFSMHFTDGDGLLIDVLDMCKPVTYATYCDYAS